VQGQVREGHEGAGVQQEEAGPAARGRPGAVAGTQETAGEEGWCGVIRQLVIEV